MNLIQTEIEGLMIIEPRIHHDNRGYFFESYNANHYQLPYAKPFVQDNEARSDKGVLRGLHFQTGEHAQGKLVRVVKGSVYDVAVDLRIDSPTFGRWMGIELSEENKKQLWVPAGFAHGYLVLEDETIFVYKCDKYYNKSSEHGIRYNDPQLNIDWPETGIEYLVSEKDMALGTLKEFSS